MSTLFSGTGNLGNIPGLQYVDVNGDKRPVADMRIFFDRRIRQDDGSYADGGGFWVTTSLWGWRAEAAAKLLPKGARIFASGRLREWRSAYKRADIIVVTKCPPQMSAQEKELLIQEIKPFPHQRIFFSYYEYGRPYSFFNGLQRIPLNGNIDALLISAIANTGYLTNYLEGQTKSLRILEFEDHHYFSNYDMSQMKRIFDNMEGENKIILTTEKDAVRMELHREFLTESNIPVFVLPVRVAFHFGEGLAFDQLVKDYLLNFRV